MNNSIEKELLNFMIEYEKKANTKDFDQIKHLIDEGAIFWFSDGSFKGLEEIRIAFEKTWNSLQNEIYKIYDLEWIVQSDQSAVCIYKFSSESTMNDKRVTFFGRGTNILIKKSGIWRVIHEHLSLKPKLQKN